MFTVTNYPLAVSFCFLAMLAWGSWANTQKMTTGGVPTHYFYRNYVLGILLLSGLAAFTLGSVGAQGRSFLSDIRQADTQNLLLAALGGVVFNVANILLVAGIQLAGMSIAITVGVGIALILGVIVNYLSQPLGNPLYLFGGVLCITVAIVLSAMASRKNARNQQKVSSQGLLISVVSGVLMGFFFRFVSAAMSPDFVNPQAGLLTPYTALVFFALGMLVSTPILTPLLKRYTTLPGDQGVVYGGIALRNHLVGLLGGGIWCVGMLSSLLASGEAGFAISYGLGQGATIVAVLWGVLYWKEFRNAPRSVNSLLGGMMVAYTAGLLLIIIAR